MRRALCDHSACPLFRPYIEDQSVRQCTRATDIIRRWQEAGVEWAPAQGEQNKLDQLPASAQDWLAALMRPYEAEQQKVGTLVNFLRTSASAVHNAQLFLPPAACLLLKPAPGLLVHIPCSFVKSLRLGSQTHWVRGSTHRRS